MTRADFTFKNLGDTGNVTVLEVSGDYNSKNPDGSQNDQPRKTIAKEYFKTHDDVDFLVYLTTFDYAMPEAGAHGFYSEVKTDTQGINKPIFDNSAQFGSPGKLQETIDLGNVTTLATNPYGPKLETTITTLNHGLMQDRTIIIIPRVPGVNFKTVFTLTIKMDKIILQVPKGE